MPGLINLRGNMATAMRLPFGTRLLGDARHEFEQVAFVAVRQRREPILGKSSEDAAKQPIVASPLELGVKVREGSRI